jgi:orotidine-5'-phosphate decarboxylase
MTSMSFMDMLLARAADKRAVCIGLDSDVSRLPKMLLGKDDPQFEFNKAIVELTADIVCCYKPNSAFYESQGSKGIQSLQATVNFIRSFAPDVPVILDAKRGDIGSSNDCYAEYVFDVVGAHAVTVHPFLGAESAEPFTRRSERGVFVLCRTSNPGAADLQDLTVKTDDGAIGRSLYEIVAMQVRDKWNSGHNCGLVTGATYPKELESIRQIAPDLPLLIPGIGVQGGSLEQTLAAAALPNGAPVVINSSRAIIFASAARDFAERAREEAVALDVAIRSLRYPINC